MSLNLSSYLTVQEAAVYFETRLDTWAWDEATLGNRDKALKQSTRIVDRYNYKGKKTDASQEHQFPRGSSDIPDDILIAVCEIAVSLLEGVDPDLEIENLSVIHQGIASAKTTYNRTFAPEHLANGCPSNTAWMHLKPYLRDAEAVSLSRVN